MWMDINLLKKVQSLNTYGDLVETYTRRTVYAEEMSVGMTETYQAMAVGYKPEVKFRLENFMDYHGEELVEYTPFMSQDTAILRVLRTYRAGDRIELVCYASIDNPKVQPVPDPPTPTEGDNNGSTEEPGQDLVQEG